MSNKYDSNEFSLDKIYRKRYLKSCHFNDLTPDDLIKKVKEIKETVKKHKYENVKISVDAYEYDEGNVGAAIVVCGYSMETDEEYKTRLTVNLRIIEKSKKSWEDKADYFTGTGEGTWQDLVNKYTTVINKLK